MEKIIENINSVLAEWNPIGVDDNISCDEYRGYIPLILKVIDDEQKLFNCLNDILINQMCTGYDPDNNKHLADLKAVCGRIIKAYEEAKASKF